MEQLEKCRPLSSVQNWLSQHQWVQSHVEIIFQYLLPFNFNKKYTEGPRIMQNLQYWDFRGSPTIAKIPQLHVRKPKMAVVESTVVKIV